MPDLKLFRIVKEKYAHELVASGRAGRWNEEGQKVIYTSEFRSLATLELLVHLGRVGPKNNFRLLEISVKDFENSIDIIDERNLVANWKSLLAYPKLQDIGSQWYKGGETLLLKVPSVIIPRESNYLIHTKHAAFESKVKIVRIEDYFWDQRL